MLVRCAACERPPTASGRKCKNRHETHRRCTQDARLRARNDDERDDRQDADQRLRAATRTELPGDRQSCTEHDRHVRTGYGNDVRESGTTKCRDQVG